jgi:hypothetical protein
MEFWYKNQLQTSTQIAVNSSSLLTYFMQIRDPRRQWVSSAFNNDSLCSTITISFDPAVTINRIALDNINWKKFNIYYNGATANALALTTTSATTTSQWTTNSESAMALMCSTLTGITSLTFDIYSTQVANAEKAIGWLCVSSQLLDFDKIPDAGSYDPNLNVEQREHKLSDGGTRIHTIERKFSASVKLRYISESFKDELYEVWRDADSFVFAPFPTSTAWDAICYEVVWPGKFEFLEYSDNNTTAGFKGTISMKEIST